MAHRFDRILAQYLDQFGLRSTCILIRGGRWHYVHPCGSQAPCKLPAAERADVLERWGLVARTASGLLLAEPHAGSPFVPISLQPTAETCHA